MKIEVRTLLAASAFSNLSAGLLGPIYAIFVQEIGGGILAASVAWTVFSLVTGVLILCFGRLEDHRLNKRLMVPVGYFILAFATLGYLFVATSTELFAIEALMGIGVAMLTPAWDAIYSTHLDKGRESSQWAYWDGGTRIIYAGGAMLGGLVATLYGFKTLFILMALFAFCAGAASSLLLRKGKKFSLKHIFKRKKHRKIIAKPMYRRKENS